MNAVLVKKALKKAGDPRVLVNLISRRVRQLNYAGGGSTRPLVQDVGRLGAADIALRELIEEKMAFEVAAATPVERPSGKNRNRPKHWARI